MSFSRILGLAVIVAVLAGMALAVYGAAQPAATGAAGTVSTQQQGAGSAETLEEHFPSRIEKDDLIVVPTAAPNFSHGARRIEKDDVVAPPAGPEFNHGEWMIENGDAVFVPASTPDSYHDAWIFQRDQRAITPTPTPTSGEHPEWMIER